MLVKLQSRVLLVVAFAGGFAAIFYPFFLPAGAKLLDSNRTLAPFIGAFMGLAVVVALTVSFIKREVSATTIALLGVLSGVVAILRFFDLPLGGNAMFFFLILVGFAFGARFGVMLGIVGMATSALLTGGIGPWLSYQMIVAAWMAGSAGVVGLFTKRLPPRVELAVVVAFGWMWAFLFGALMNLSSWPFGVSTGPLAWQAGLGLHDGIGNYWRFYVSTSLAWDAAGALANAVLLSLVGVPTLLALRRIAPRLSPDVRFLSTPDTSPELEIVA